MHDLLMDGHIFVMLKNCPYGYYSGSGDHLESSTPGGSITPATPRKIPTPTVSVTPSTSAPDLDRSAISITKDHLSSGSTSSVVSLSGDYRDASGKVIRRSVNPVYDVHVC